MTVEAPTGVAPSGSRARSAVWVDGRSVRDRIGVLRRGVDSRAATVHPDSAIATLNLVGSIAFGIAAVASYVVPSTGSAIDLAWANLFTALGGVCFFAGSVLLLPKRTPPPGPSARLTRH